MNVAVLALLLCVPLGAQGPAPANLDFGSGTLAGWEGEGFGVLRADDGRTVVYSGDDVAPGRKALLHRLLVVPPGRTAPSDGRSGTRGCSW